MFEELNDDEWARIAALVADEPVHPHRRGRPRAETRAVTNAVLWILTTGHRWSKLPGRYPSSPTCRRRFDEWLADGTLIEMVNVLSAGGRGFAYVPQPQTPQPVAPTESTSGPTPASESPRLRGVFWTNPETWQSAGTCTYRAGDLPVASSRSLEVSSGKPPLCMSGSSLPALSAASVHQRTDDYCGYTVHAIAQPVMKPAMHSFRASAEIVKEGKRIERSGLIGPRFAEHESAQRHALEWARDWIDRHTRGAAAEPAMPQAVRADDNTHAAPQRPATIADLAATAGHARNTSREVPITRHAPDWLLHAEGRGDAKPPEVIYHS